ncbi:hypothetical protein BD560DRAFT_489418 [Blakeslea trispora]|nr:hypothetical protein BD560DRAFT_489418 [Blakeslea trispora]
MSPDLIKKINIFLEAGKGLKERNCLLMRERTISTKDIIATAYHMSMPLPGHRLNQTASIFKKASLTPKPSLNVSGNWSIKFGSKDSVVVLSFCTFIVFSVPSRIFLAVGASRTSLLSENRICSVQTDVLEDSPLFMISSPFSNILVKLTFFFVCRHSDALKRSFGICACIVINVYCIIMLKSHERKFKNL